MTDARDLSPRLFIFFGKIMSIFRESLLPFRIDTKSVFIRGMPTLFQDQTTSPAGAFIVEQFGPGTGSVFPCCYRTYTGSPGWKVLPVGRSLESSLLKSSLLLVKEIIVQQQSG